MSASQRRKGKVAELEVVNLARAHGLDARRAWENATAPDAITRRTDVVIAGKRAQCKRRARAWHDLYAALCGVDLVVCRSDSTPWLVVQRFEDWAHSIEPDPEAVD
jgi:hypothetical protein